MQVERSLPARLAALVATMCVFAAAAAPAFAASDMSKRTTKEASLTLKAHSSDYFVVTMQEALITN